MADEGAQLRFQIDRFGDFLTLEQGTSPRTLEAYRRDVERLVEYATTKGALSPVDVTSRMLRAAVHRVGAMGLRVQQVDIVIVAERPKIASHRELMRACLADALGVATESVSVKGKTNEGMGWIGRGEGIACIAVATVESIAP